MVSRCCDDFFVYLRKLYFNSAKIWYNNLTYWTKIKDFQMLREHGIIACASHKSGCAARIVLLFYL